MRQWSARSCGVLKVIAEITLVTIEGKFSLTVKKCWRRPWLEGCGLSFAGIGWGFFDEGDGALL